MREGEEWRVARRSERESERWGVWGLASSLRHYVIEGTCASRDERNGPPKRENRKPTNQRGFLSLATDQ